MPNPDIGKWAAVGGRTNRGRPQSPEHVRRRAESVKASLANTTRECVQCGDSFTPTQAAQRYCSGRCWNAVQAAKRYANSAESRHRMKLNRREYDALVAVEGEQCAICGGDNGKKRLPVDHDHERGVIRGLLCHKCNTAVGLMADDPDRLIKAAVYLRRSRLRSVV